MSTRAGPNLLPNLRLTPAGPGRLRALRRASFAALTVALSACAPLRPGPEQPLAVPLAGSLPPNAFSDDEDFLAYPLEPASDSLPTEPPLPADYCIWDRLRAGYGIRRIEHPRVKAELKFFVQHRPTLYALIERARPFLAFILDEVEQRGLPSELALLPAVESGYRTHAYSPDGAVGLWQFMPATATRFGLETDWWYDGRKDPIESTRAALDYIEYLLRRFKGNMFHALAAYNAGGAKVARAVRQNRLRGRPTDFWSLDLPGETDRYVPRLLALASIVADPAAYGVVLPPISDKTQLAVVAIEGQIDLHVAAKLIDQPIDEFIALNAGFKRTASPPAGPHRLVVREELAETLEQALRDLPEEQWLRWRRHRIRSGDTLSDIAGRYGVTIAAIQRANHLKNHDIRAGDELLIPLSEAAAVNLASAPWNGARISYRVRKGDSLYVIARRFEVSVADLRRWNDISGRLIKPGQQLVVFLDPIASAM